jgi:hypothetical protein
VKERNLNAHSENEMCLLSCDEKFHSVILPPASTKFETIKKKDGGLISPSHTSPQT